MDDPLGVINHIARTLQFRHHISAHRELAEVNGPILRGRIFLGAPGTVYRFNPETGVGDWFGEVGAVHLRQMDARLQVVEENQLLDAVASLQLHLLGCGDGNVSVVALLLLYPVSTRLTVGEQDFT